MGKTRSAAVRPRLTAREYRTARAVAEDFSQAWQRMRAMSDVERLRWVVAFSQKPLAPLAPAVLSRLGNELRGLMSASGISATGDFGPLPRAAVEEIQSRIRAALEALVREEGREVPMPLVSAVISRMHFTVEGVLESRKARYQVRHEAKSETDAILASVFELIKGEAGHQLHPCRSCGIPVVVNRRQVYCGPKCSQRVRDWLRSHSGQHWPGPR